MKHGARADHFRGKKRRRRGEKGRLDTQHNVRPGPQDAPHHHGCRANRECERGQRSPDPAAVRLHDDGAAGNRNLPHPLPRIPPGPIGLAHEPAGIMRWRRNDFNGMAAGRKELGKFGRVFGAADEFGRIVDRVDQDARRRKRTARSSCTLKIRGHLIVLEGHLGRGGRGSSKQGRRRDGHDHSPLDGLMMRASETDALRSCLFRTCGGALRCGSPCFGDLQGSAHAPDAAPFGAPAEAPECRIAHELAQRSIGFRQVETRYRLRNRRHRQRSGNHRQRADPCRTRHSHARRLSHSQQQRERSVQSSTNGTPARFAGTPDPSLANAPLPASSGPDAHVGSNVSPGP